MEHGHSTDLPWVVNGAAGAIGTNFMRQNAILNDTNGRAMDGVRIELLNDVSTIDQIEDALRRTSQSATDRPFNVEKGGNDYLVIDGKKIQVSSITRPEELAEFSRRELGTHGMFSSTGRNLTGRGSRLYTENGSRYVLVPSPTDPAHEDDPIGPVLIPGLTDFALGRSYTGQTSTSNDSCIVKNVSTIFHIIDSSVGVVEASTDINHSATRGDLTTLLGRRSSGHFEPTATDQMQIRPSAHVNQGLGRVLGQGMRDKVRTSMTRYPVEYGVLVDINFLPGRATNPDELREIFQAAAGNAVGPNEMIKVIPRLESTKEIVGNPTNCIVIADSIRGRSMMTLRTAFDNLVAPSRSAVRSARIISDWDAANRR